MLRILQNSVLVVLALSLSPLMAAGQEPPYTDRSHFSQVFGREKQYRLYLPDSYLQSEKRYPVIYFFHGWGGRHFKDDNALLEYELIKILVEKYQTILVMWDGNMDGIEPRPYNVGNHEDIKYPIQMKDYFPELVGHIDSAYRTIPNREKRGIIGFSMGGFMSLYLAGKYPDMVCSAVSFAGSPEFFIGYPENHTLYPVRYTFKNLDGVNVQIHNGDTDILYFLNNEVYEGALWEGFPLSYRKFDGGHMVDKPGETKVFEMAMQFISDSFRNPSPLPSGFTHYDLYSNFTVRGYQVRSGKSSPGFITLRNTNKSGFGIFTNKWLPSGPSAGNFDIRIVTPPLYLPEKQYTLKTYQHHTGTTKISRIKSDSEGKLTVTTGSKGTETGIFLPGDAPFLSYLNYDAGGFKYLPVNQSTPLRIRLFNRAGIISGGLKVILRTSDRSVILGDSVLLLKKTGKNPVISLPPVSITSSKKAPEHAYPTEININLTISSGEHTWYDSFLVPVLFDVPIFENVKIDDGIAIRDSAFGQGNGNGMADPGEKIMVYQNLHRLRLYTNDKYVISSDENLADEMIPAIWPDGFTLSSVISISPDCPANHIIECVASYETKTYNPIERKLTWGKVRIRVR